MATKYLTECTPCVIIEVDRDKYPNAKQKCRFEKKAAERMSNNSHVDQRKETKDEIKEVKRLKQKLLSEKVEKSTKNKFYVYFYAEEDNDAHKGRIRQSFTNVIRR